MIFPKERTKLPEAALPTSHDREGAKKFLEELQQHLDEDVELRSSDTVRRKVQDLAASAKHDKPDLKQVSYESLFSDNFVVPAIPPLSFVGGVGRPTSTAGRGSYEVSG